MHCASVLLLLLPSVDAFCSIYGPAFPRPRNLASSPILQSALKQLRSTYESATSAGNSSSVPVASSDPVGVQIFDLDNQKPIFEFYHDGSILSKTTGVQKIDGDSIWRIASISKLITVYVLLKEVGDSYWDVPITDVIPELKGDEKWREDEVSFVKWKDVTIGALAGQISGIVNNFISIQGLNPLEDPATAAKLGLPPLKASDSPVCVLSVDPKIGLSCTREEFFAGLDTRRPVFHSNTQPLYSNTPFMILGYAIESLTGKSFADLIDSLNKSLGLTGTSVRTPDQSKGLIPYSLQQSGWTIDAGEAAPIGGMYSSLNDLSRLGRSVLNSTLLDPNTTRAWLKPTSFTSDLRSSVGRPWEIYRVDTKSSRGVIDIFSKGGDIGLYHTWLGLVPDYGIGFTVGAATDGSTDKKWFAQQIVQVLFPALETEALEQAKTAFAGTYTTTNGTNSSMVLSLTTEAGKPGLGIKQFTSNGADVLAVLSQVLGEPLTEESFRMLPTNLEQELGDGTRKTAWRSVTSNLDPNSGDSAFSACPSWFNVDGQTYGRSSFDEMVFTLGSDGKATTVGLRAFKAELQRRK